MSKQRYRVDIVDIDYCRKVISCQNACPVHTDAQGYINAIARGDYEEGYLTARQPNPFASTCGRVCNAPCEEACRRNNIDHPVTIRALKRFLCERHGVENKERLGQTRAPFLDRDDGLIMERAPGNSNTINSTAALLKANATRKSGRRKARVAIIGAGPAGLTTANDLAISGYEVTVFEAAPIPGGMLVLGIPEYRLPRSLMRFEIEEILKQGVELKLNMRLGKDFSIADLRKQGYEAIFIAIGAYVDRDPGVEGTNLESVIYSLDFLREVNLGYRVAVGNRVLVVGGGGTAVDAARTMLRLGEGFLEKDGVAALDAARGALRLGAREVHMLYRASREEMRAPDEEIQDAIEEGVFLHTNRAPLRILGEAGKVTGLETIRVDSFVDETGKRVRNFIEGSEEVFDGDTVIIATGQGSDLSFIKDEDGIEFTDNGTITVNAETMATTSPGIFAGGDVAFGPRIIIDAVKDGHQAARSIDSYLQQDEVAITCQATLKETESNEWLAEGGLEISIERAALLPLEKRAGVSEVEMAYDEDTAVEQASRCLRCHIQTIFDADLCILCGACVDVCPQNCYKLVRLDKIEGDERLEAMVKARYGVTLAAFRENGEMLDAGAAMIKDESSCIRCGLCAKRCPTGAVTMEAFQFQEEMTYQKASGETAEEVSVR